MKGKSSPSESSAGKKRWKMTPSLLVSYSLLPNTLNNAPCALLLNFNWSLTDDFFESHLRLVSKPKPTLATFIYDFFDK